MTLKAISLSLLLLSANAAGKAADRLVFFSTEAKVGVDSGGSIVDVTADPSLSPAIRQVVESYVRQWRFSAPTKAGHPVAGVTYVQLDACAARKDDKYEFVVRYRGNGPGQLGALGAPEYPHDALRRGETTKLKLSFRVLADGRASIDELTLVEGNEHVERAFRESVRSWLAKGRFRPEQVDGAPIETRVSMPIRFFTDRKDFLGSTAFVDLGNQHSAQAFAAQLPECQAVLDASEKLERQTVLDSPFQLQPVFLNNDERK